MIKEYNFNINKINPLNEIITGDVEILDLSKYNITTVSSLRNCTLLHTIILPASVKKILYYAFYDCSSLTNIIFNGTIEQWNQISLGSWWNSNVPATYVQCSDGQVTL